ncbi:unnamed protein product [Prunus armeniaca]
MMNKARNCWVLEAREEACSLDVDRVNFHQSGWVTGSLGFQGFCESGSSYGDEAPPAFLLGSPLELAEERRMDRVFA